MARRHRVDVNGRPLDGGLISLTGKLPGRLEPLVILVHLRPDDTVASVEATLLGNLIMARTDANSAHLLTSDVDPYDREFLTGDLAGERTLTLAEILAILRAAYCGTSAPEYMPWRTFFSIGSIDQTMSQTVGASSSSRSATTETLRSG